MKPVKKLSQVQAARQLFSKGSYPEAIEMAKRAQTVPGLRAEAEAIESACLLRLGKHLEAETKARSSLERNNDSAEAKSLLALALRGQKKLDEAKDQLEQTVQQHPDHADAWHNLSIICFELAMQQEALKAALKAAELRPDSIDAQLQLGRCALNARNPEVTQRAYGEALRKNPNLPEGYNGLGGAALLRNVPKEALKHFDRALQINPKLSSALANKALALKNTGDFVGATESLRVAREVDPSNPEHTWNLSLTLLAQGNFEEGFNNYEIRYDKRRLAADRVKPPVTNVKMLGVHESPKGMTIAVLHEQGLGDMLQFIRLTQLLKREGATVVVVSPKALLPALATVPWIDYITSNQSFNVKVDRWIFVASLAHRYIKREADIPALVPYIWPIAKRIQKWKEILPNEGGHLRIGLVWAGRPSHSNDSNRSTALNDFQHLAQIPGVSLYSLQMGERAADLEGTSIAIQDLGKHIEDFADTAAALSRLDALVTIDSSPAHIAGAIGKRAFVLIPKVFDFRWLIDRTDSPWYPNMVLLRQSEIGDWQSVHHELHHHIKALAEEKNKRQPSDQPVDAPPLFDVLSEAELADAGLRLQTKLAVAAHQEGRLVEAEAIYRWVLSIDPHNLDCLRNLGVLLRRAKKFAESAHLYEQAIKLAPSDNVLLRNFANLLCDVGQEKRAEQLVRKALENDPNQAAAWYLLALALENQGRSTEAWDPINRALLLDPKRPDYEALLGITAFRTGRVEQAYPLLVAALEREPKRLDLRLTMAQYLQGKQRFDEAESLYRESIALKEDHSMTYMNWGGLYIQTGDFKKAEALTDRAIELDPQNYDAKFNKALLLLINGNLKEGWQAYENRMDPRRKAKDRIVAPTFSKPYWQGQPLNGKTILLFPEQGYGDSIQFIRYAKILKARGATVWVALRDALIPLFQAQPYIDRVLRNGEPAGAYDFWTLPLSLPARMQTTLDTIPADIPYLHIPTQARQRWQSEMGPRGSRPRVGIVWQGSPNHANDAQRSIRLTELTPLLGEEGVEWVSLNYKTSEQDLALLSQFDVREMGSRISDFVDLAAAIDQLDLLISIDSAPVHLAGALGKPVWTMLPHSPDFRWMLERSDSPWYPTMRLFRQSESRQWASVVGRVADGLREVKRRMAARQEPTQVLAFGWPIDPLERLARWIAARVDGLLRMGIRLRLAEVPLQPLVEVTTQPRGLQTMWQEWEIAKPHFEKVWSRQRPVVLEGAFLVVPLGERGLPIAGGRVTGDRRIGLLQTNQISLDDPEVVQRLQAYVGFIAFDPNIAVRFDQLGLGPVATLNAAPSLSDTPADHDVLALSQLIRALGTA